eukprot:TRINITY_DN107555_c0_g1_i1.p1 TRINITY_DN107555_c0_g1~~TRINITY_DN107555_c0_g1_i1.p1  ORF type:complete len:1278 (+),score=237.54 TRINITY_DN107555_c0_g1_i1:29-3835(+)
MAAPKEGRPRTRNLMAPAAKAREGPVRGGGIREIKGASIQQDGREARRCSSPDDLLLLEDLDDEALLDGLRQRYQKQQIYTWVGGVLVSVNPYCDVGVFAEELAAQYAEEAQAAREVSPFGGSCLRLREGSRELAASGRSIQSLPPHLYAVVASALHAPGNRHALLITGESGAGKTEATRAALGFLARTCGAADTVRDRLLHSNPVLEAFGNAKTRQNGNSSRFGKFIEVHFSPSNQLKGATCRTTLLEASRVIGELPKAERTYHIFYQIRALLGTLAGCLPGAALPSRDESRELFERIAGTPAWREVARVAGNAMVASPRLQEGPPDQSCLDSFEDLYRRMLVMGMTAVDVMRCASVVAAVTLLADGAAPTEEGSLSAALEVLLGISRQDLASFLTRVETTVGSTQRERLVRSRSENESKMLLSSLAQELYVGLFSWVTRLVARSLSPSASSTSEGSVSASGTDDSALSRRLGLLDLYGFEVFASNGFEQLLINYCNERIQQLFNRQVFLREAEEYQQEGLDGNGCWQQLAGACSLPALSLLEGEPGNFAGIFGVINDRARCGFDPSSRGDGAEVAEAIAASCHRHPSFRKAHPDTGRVFGVAHFAGEVFYEARHFVHKNASSYKPDIIAFLRQSSNAFVSELFEVESDRRGSGPESPSSAVRRRRLLGTTITSAFRSELNELCSMLEAHECRHIRCLRPNDNQAPLRFDDAPVLRQCRYSGLLEATRIRRCGFPHRRELDSFAARYAPVLRASGQPRGSSLAQFVEAAARTWGFQEDELRIGRSKVFLREAALSWLEESRITLSCRYIAAGLRGWQVRRSVAKQRKAIVCIQAFVRGLWVRRRLEEEALQRLEEELRQARAAAAAESQAAAARKLQKWWRQCFARRVRATQSLAVAPLTPRSQERWKAMRRAKWSACANAVQGRYFDRSADVTSAPVAQTPARSSRGAPGLGTRRRPESHAPGSTALVITPGACSLMPRTQDKGVTTPRATAASAGDVSRKPFERSSSLTRVSSQWGGKENEAPTAFASLDAGRKDFLKVKGHATSPPSSPKLVWQASPRVGSPDSIAAAAMQRRVSAPLAKPCSPQRIHDRLQAQLLRVGRALREKELPQDKAELLRGVLDTVMAPDVASARVFSDRPRRQQSPPWRIAGKSDSWTPSVPSTPRQPFRTVRTESAQRVRPGLSARSMEATSSAADTVVRSPTATRLLADSRSNSMRPREGCWAAPEGFFCFKGPSTPLHDQSDAALKEPLGISNLNSANLKRVNA